MRIRERKEHSARMAVDLPELQAMLSCGRTTAVKIAKESGAGFKIGARRLYSVDRIRAYMDKLTEEEALRA